jgi:hypothetical protein
MRNVIRTTLAFLIVGAASGAGAQTAAATRISVDMTLIEPSGATVAERKVEVPLGRTETVNVERNQGRTVSIETTLSAGKKAGCFKINLVVRDRRIDATGHFAKTVWQSATEPCDAQPVTLGPKNETQVRVSLKRVK